MPLTRTRLALALLALAALLPLPAGAGEAEGRRSAMALEPGPDGAYALPLPSGARLPFSFEPGESALRLTELSFDPAAATIRATLRYLGEQPASALSVEIRAYSGEGNPLTAVARTEDWSAGADAGSAQRFRSTGLSDPVHERGLLFPGQTHRIELGVPVPGAAEGAAPAHARLSVSLLVYADATFTGSARLAREVLGAREVAAEELAFWSLRLEEALRGAASEEEARSAVARLLGELEAEAETLPQPAQAVRANLRSNLEPLAGPLPPGDLPSVRDELGNLAAWLRLDLEERARHVPRKLPEAPPSGRSGNRLRERFHDGTGGHGDTGDDEDMNCDCGGSLTASVAQTESRLCDGSATGWRVNESWSYACRNGDGGQTTGGSGSLNGVGGCIEGAMCFANRYCPPQFGIVALSEDFYDHIWNRTVTNQHIVVGVCTSRCVIDGSFSLTLKCPCDPSRRPGCTIDGCPVLIETGAGGYRLTDFEGGVHFDLDGDGHAEHVSWTVADGDDAWLALDRNGNGVIDDGTELFGDATEQPFSLEPNGFEALAVFDRPEAGGNGDGQITAADAVFGDLLLWLDRDHDGVSSPEELTGLAEAGVVAIELDYHASHRRDRHGNEFRYFTRVWYASGARKLATDVFLLLE
ncbi:MAG TPA: hypothetical protein VLF66_02525 [Thermoanaerobaculia bacterium]|nr:hypothetical protein [Thermoanaerobaculia bacterium]